MKKPRINKICPQCGKSFSVPPSLDRLVCCSRKCGDIRQRGERKIVNCYACGKPFEAKKDHGKWQKFCNRKCFKTQQNHPIYKDCGECGKRFKAYWQPDKSQYRKYCSKHCYNLASISLPEKLCPCCGKSFRPPSQRTEDNEEVFCSRECHAEVRCGENSPSYKGGSYVGSVGVRFVALGPHTRKAGYKGEHRLVVEKAIGRKLKHWSEPILHLNRNKTDNRLENLYVCKDISHMGKILQGKLSFPTRSNIEDLK